jgi:hypothetical protein
VITDGFDFIAVIFGMCGAFVGSNNVRGRVSSALPPLNSKLSRQFPVIHIDQRFFARLPYTAPTPRLNHAMEFPILSRYCFLHSPHRPTRQCDRIRFILADSGNVYSAHNRII